MGVQDHGVEAARAVQGGTASRGALADGRIGVYWPVMIDVVKRISHYLASHAPARFRELPGPASHGSLRRLERQLGKPLPQSLVELFRCQDGLGSFDGVDLLPVDMLLAERDSMLEQEQYYAGADIDTAGPVRARFWHAEWLPWGLLHGSSDYHCIDCAPAPGGTVGQIIHVDTKSFERRVLAPSLYSYLTRLADALESGALVVNQGQPLSEEGEFWTRGDYVHYALESSAKPVAYDPRRGLTAESSSHRVVDMFEHLAANRTAEAQAALAELARDWLKPAAVGAINQDFSRSHLLELFDKVPPTSQLEVLRERVRAAPEPEIVLPEGDFF